MMAGTLLVFPDDDSIIPDVSRITGVPWFYARVHQRGALHPVIDADTVSGVGRLRLTLALVGGHYYCDAKEGVQRARGNDIDHIGDRVVGGDAA